MTMKKTVDISSEKFKKEFKKTLKFTDKIIKRYKLKYNDDGEINFSIQMGLTKNKILHGKRYCPCFLVTKTRKDRICPCKPSIDEILLNGSCHCGIFNQIISPMPIMKKEKEK